MSKLKPLSDVSMIDPSYFYFEGLPSKINEHIHAINQILHVSDNKQTARFGLHTPEFWGKLRLENGFSPSIEALEQAWQRHAPFVDIRVPELVFLKDEHLEPLEKALIKQWKVLKRGASGWIVRPQWRMELQAKQLAVIEKNLEYVRGLKEKLQPVLLDRCVIQEQIGWDRRRDDMESAFLQLLKQQGLSCFLVVESKPVTLSLDDDTRIGVYDWLLDQDPEQKSTLSKIIASLTGQAGYHPPFTSEQLKKELQATDVFCRSFKEALGFVERSHAQGGLWLVRFLEDLGFSSENRVLKILSLLWEHKKILGLLFTLSLYFIFAPAIVTGLTLTLGSHVARFANTLLFYGVALGPFWFMAKDMLQKSWAGIIKIFRERKQQECRDALDCLENTQRYIVTKLSTGILDIAHYDIALLRKSALGRIKNIENLLNNLSHSKLWERVAMIGHFNSHKVEIEKQLVQQKNMIKARLQSMAQHISERLEKSLSQLKVEVGQNKFTPLICQNQLKRLRAFVHEYGTRDTILKFEEHSNPLPLFLEAVQSKIILSKNKKPKGVKSPWGSGKLQVPVLNGWQNLFTNLLGAGEQKDAALALLGLLSGERIIDFATLQKYVLCLSSGDPAHLLQRVQDYLFATLNDRPAFIVHLLAENQKRSILDWAIEHRSEIEKANKYFVDAFSQNKMGVRTLLSDIDDQTLVKYFTLLEGAEFAAQLGDQFGKPEFYNIAKECFENLTGGDVPPLAYLRFIPENKKAGYLKNIAQKRVDWLLTHLANGVDPQRPFNESDVELFNNNRLRKMSPPFDFADVVRQHSLFQNGLIQSDMRHFLLACQQGGFDDGSLLKAYIGQKQFVSLNLAPSLHLYQPTPEKKSAILDEVLERFRDNPTVGLVF